jgi:MFS family permease
LLIVGMDVMIVNVALPAIQRDLHARLAALQWILDAYTLAVASFLMLAGSMSDRFRRLRVFQLGLGVSTLRSLLCSRAGTIGQLIGFGALRRLATNHELPSSDFAILGNRPIMAVRKAQPRELEFADSFGASPVSSALDRSARRDSGKASINILCNHRH